MRGGNKSSKNSYENKRGMERGRPKKRWLDSIRNDKDYRGLLMCVYRACEKSRKVEVADPK